MSGAIQTVTRHELAVALGWLVDAGVDTVVGEAPYDWLGSAVAPPPLPARAIAPPATADSATLAIGTDSLAALAAAVADLDARPAGIAAMPPLFADGDPAGEIMVIGDRPTAADATAGRVFADAAGVLLDRMLASIGRSRDTAYLANLVAWPTPADRAPTPAEIAAHAPFLRRQIQLARPRVVLALGQTAAMALCQSTLGGSTQGIARLRGRWHEVDFDGVTVAVMPIFHPAHLLLHPAHKALAWADLCAFRARISQ